MQKKIIEMLRKELHQIKKEFGLNSKVSADDRKGYYQISFDKVYSEDNIDLLHRIYDLSDRFEDSFVSSIMLINWLNSGKSTKGELIFSTSNEKQELYNYLNSENEYKDSIKIEFDLPKLDTSQYFKDYFKLLYNSQKSLSSTNSEFLEVVSKKIEDYPNNLEKLHNKFLNESIMMGNEFFSFTPNSFDLSKQLTLELERIQYKKRIDKNKGVQMNNSIIKNIENSDVEKVVEKITTKGNKEEYKYQLAG